VQQDKDLLNIEYVQRLTKCGKRTGWGDSGIIMERNMRRAVGRVERVDLN
jgi:hypothetical protein